MHHNHHNHTQHNHHAHGAYGTHGGHGSAAGFLRRFWIVTFLLIPLALTNETVATFVSLGPFAVNRWIQFLIATVIVGFAFIFFQHAWHEIQARKYGMMTLVSLAVGAGYLFSVASTFVPTLETQFYLEIATLVWVLLFGHYLEARSGAAAGNALQEVAKLLPGKAHVLRDGEETDIAVSELSTGDIVVVKPGEKIPADGNVREGGARVDESLISGESKPVGKKQGDEVVAGSICLDGSLTVVLSRVGEHSTIGQIQKLVADAQATKPRSQRLADKAAAVLTFVAGITALLTLVVWTAVIGEPFVFAMTLAITVLVITCPHALGLAIPTVTTISTSLAVKNGLFIKSLAKLETITKATYVIFDKTGTLTKGTFGVTDVVPLGDTTKEDLLYTAVCLDQHSSHVVGKSIVAHAKAEGARPGKTESFKNIPGRGIKARINGTLFFSGNKALMKEQGVLTKEAQKVFEDLAQKGKTLSAVASEDHILGIIGLADEIKEESHDAVEQLHSFGIKVAMLTGDNEGVARSVAEALGVDTYMADVLPEDKYKHVKALQEKGNVVLMVGDGVNDAPALTQADVGIAIGAGTDVAVEAGDVVLTRSNPKDIVRLVVLAKKVYGKMIQNLIWALGYNIVAIPAAAGIFAPWGLFLRPEIGALVMSVSTVIVVLNAMTLKRANLATS